jgi:O-acetylhomoserine/O-acetylserine sulfhydrylase-like pyridoxal-dependent enzyme
MKRNDRRRNAPAGFSTRAIHLGYDPATEQGALTPPIFMTSTYAFESAEDGAALFRGELAGGMAGGVDFMNRLELVTRAAWATPRPWSSTPPA